LFFDLWVSLFVFVEMGAAIVKLTAGPIIAIQNSDFALGGSLVI
jgi:hypothetical protein